MSEMIERVAKVLREIDFEVGKPNYSQAARAVIAVMREPTRHMVDAGDAFQTTLACWRIMIDEVLR